MMSLLPRLVAASTAAMPSGGDSGKEAMTGDKMMAGVVADPSKPSAEKKLLPVTALGRYMKVLLSSNEFLFMN